MSVWARLARGRGPSGTRRIARECVTHHIRHKKPPLSPAPRLSRIAAQYTDVSSRWTQLGFGSTVA